MRGQHTVLVRLNTVQFEICVKRSLTILRGNSATGKTTLVEMVSDYAEDGRDSGVDLQCDVPCHVLTGAQWSRELSSIEDSIVFIDEGNRFMHSTEFARAVRESSNYYVLVTRRDLPSLPYAVDEVLELFNTTSRPVRKGSKDYRYYAKSRPVYRMSGRHLYSDSGLGAVIPEAVVVEDSGSGYQFYKAICEPRGIACYSAGGVGRLRSRVLQCDEASLLVVADGAACGPYVGALLGTRAYKKVRLFLPESFEWVLLKSGLLRDKDIPDILSRPFDFIDCESFFSWERFFTDLLVKRSAHTRYAYSKSKLNQQYLLPAAAEKVMGELPAGLGLPDEPA